jgi:hypothetical protein
MILPAVREPPDRGASSATQPEGATLLREALQHSLSGLHDIKA